MTNTVKLKSLENVDWDKTPRIQGRVEAMGRMPADEDGKERPFLVIDNGRARFRVFESFALQELFAAIAVGDGVDILHLGKAALANNRSIRRFRYTVFDGAGYTIPDDAASTSPAVL